MQPPEGPPVWAALNFLPFGMPPPISSTISRRVVPMGISTRPVLWILPPRAKTLVPLRLLGAHGGEPLGAVEDDLGDVGVGLHVVQDGGLAEQALDRREGRTGTGLAAVALDGGHQRGLLAADEGAGAQAELDVEVEAGAEDILAQQAVFPGLLDGDLQALDRDGVLGADIDIALVGADGIAGDGHGLQHAWGSPSSTERSMNAPGSPSSALQQTYF